MNCVCVCSSEDEDDSSDPLIPDLLELASSDDVLTGDGG